MPSDGTVDVTEPRASDAKPAWKRFLPIALIACGALAAILFARDYLSFEALAQNYQALTAWRDANFLLSIGVFALLYVTVVAFSVPGATWLTLAGGFLFGTWLGGAIIVPSATLGALLIFLAARTAVGDALRERAGTWVSKMEKGFSEGAVSYLLIMRLVPAIPFFIANLAPAFLGVRVWTFVWTTFVGIIPGTLVFISIGAGLGEQLSRGESPDLGVIFEPHILGPLLGLAALASLPLVLKKFGVIGKSKT